MSFSLLLGHCSVNSIAKKAAFVKTFCQDFLSGCFVKGNCLDKGKGRSIFHIFTDGRYLHRRKISSQTEDRRAQRVRPPFYGQKFDKRIIVADADEAQ